MTSRGGRAKWAEAPVIQEPQDPMKIKARSWKKDDVKVGHFIIKKWVPVSQESPTPEIQQAGRVWVGGKRKSGSQGAQGQQGGGRFTRKKKEEMAAVGDYVEDLLPGLEAVPILTRDYMRNAAQQQRSYTQDQPTEQTEEGGGDGGVGMAQQQHQLDHSTALGDFTDAVFGDAAWPDLPTYLEDNA